MIVLLFGCQAIENPQMQKPTQENQDTSVSEQDVEPEEPEETEDTNVIPNEDPENDTAPPSEPSQEEQIDISTMLFKATHNSYTGEEKGSIVDV